MNKKLIPPLLGTGFATILLIIQTCEGTGRFRLDPRNLELANRLSSCPSYEIVGGDVRVGYTPAGNVVFDVRRYKSDCRLIDPLHLLLQFGDKIRESQFQSLDIAAGGRMIYRLAKADLDELSEQYELGARIWAFDHWPERLRKPDGEKAFGSWTGGFIAVLQQQAEDLNEALRTWLDRADPK